jgi:hypothetical protein
LQQTNNTHLLSRLTCILYYLYRNKKFRKEYKIFSYKLFNFEPRWN